MRWVVVFLLGLLLFSWLLLRADVLPPALANVVESITGLACSLAIPAFVISAYAAPGIYAGLSDDVRRFWERIRTRRRDVEELERKIAHLDKPYHMLQLGTVLAAQGRLARAGDLFRQALERDPASLDAKYRLALCRYKQGIYPEATTLLEEVHAVKPDHDYGLAYLRLAESCRRAGKPERAAEVFEILLKFYPGHPEGSYEYALLAAEQGDVARATRLMCDVIFTVRHSPGFQRRRSRHWSLKARWWLFRNRT